MRALLMIRLSSETDESTSPERQRLTGQALCESRDWPIVGYAEDLGVSALKYGPLERPELRVWMTEKINEWDVLVFWRLDRFVRSVMDMADMIRWAEKHKKTLISVSEPWFDLSTDVGKILALMISMFANMEAKATQTRVLDAHRYLRTTNRWAGGPAPYGYKAVPNTGGEGKILALDEEAAAVVRQIFTWVIAGVALNAVAIRLNAKGVVAPEVHRRKQGNSKKEPRTKNGQQRGLKWTRNSVLNIVTNEAVMGLKTSGNKSVRNADGFPIRMAEEIVSRDDFARAQQQLSERTNVRTRSEGPTLLLDVIFCAYCGAKMYRYVSSKRKAADGQWHRYSYYRCSNKQLEKPGCSSKLLRLEDTEEWATLIWLDEVGFLEMTERVYVPGIDHSEEMEELASAIAVLTERQETAGPVQLAAIQKRIDAHEARYAQLAAEPARAERWEMKSTGVTFGALFYEAQQAVHSHGSTTCVNKDYRPAQSPEECIRTEGEPDPDIQTMRTLMMQSGFKILAGTGTVEKPHRYSFASELQSVMDGYRPTEEDLWRGSGYRTEYMPEAVKKLYRSLRAE